MYPGTKRKWIGLQPEVGNHLSLWYELANNQTNRPYNFLKRAYKILQKPKHRKLKDRKYYERLIFLSFVSCQLVAKFILLTAGFRLSWGKTETKLKQGCGRWKTFSKGMVHRIIATIAVNLVWNASVAKNFSSWLRLPGCWIYERPVTKSRHWYLLLLSPSQYRPSKANSALSFYFWKKRILAATIFQRSQSFLQLTLLSLCLIRLLGAIV